MTDFVALAQADDLEGLNRAMDAGETFDPSLIDVAALAPTTRVLAKLLHYDSQRWMVENWGWAWFKKDISGVLQRAEAYSLANHGVNAKAVAVITEALGYWDDNDSRCVQSGSETFSGSYIGQRFNELANAGKLEGIEEMTAQGAHFYSDILEASAEARTTRVLSWLLSDATRRWMVATWGWYWDREDLTEALEKAIEYHQDQFADDDDEGNSAAIAYLESALDRWDLMAVVGDAPENSAAERPAPAKRIL